MSNQAFEVNAVVDYCHADGVERARVLSYSKGWYTIALLDADGVADEETKARAKDLALVEWDELDEDRPMSNQTHTATAADFRVDAPVALAHAPDSRFGVVTEAKRGWIEVREDDTQAVSNHRAKHLIVWTEPTPEQPDDADCDGDEEEDELPRTMASQLARARPRYIKSRSASGKTSAHCGDKLARLLSGCLPAEAMMLAQAVLDHLEEPNPKGFTVEQRYGHLNPGQQRMNAGNLVRARVKKGVISVDEVTRLYAEMEDVSEAVNSAMELHPDEQTGYEA